MRYQNIYFSKRSQNLFFFLLFISISYLVGCSKTEEPENEPAVYLPNISMTSPDSNKFIIGQDEEFLLSVMATSNATSNSSLILFQVLRNFNNEGYEIVEDSAINTQLFMLEDYACFSNTETGLEDWKVIVKDASGGTDSVMFTTEILNLSPIVSFLSGEYQPGQERIDSDTTLFVGEQFVFGILAESASIENLDRILVERNYENVSSITIFDSTLNASSFTNDFMTFSYPNQGLEEFTLTAWDKKNRQSSVSFSITTIPVASNITIYEDKILGAQNSTTGIAFATDDGTVYQLADAKDNAEKIDFVYFYGATNLATIAAPDDATAAQVYNNAQNGLQTWSVLNNTRYKMTDLSGDEFNLITSLTQLIITATYPSSPDQSRINYLSTGDVLAFETAGELFGLIRIDNIITGANGLMEITVKVQ